MFDMDGNERVDRDEFLVLERIFSSSEHGGERVDLFKEVEQEGEEGESDGEKAEPMVRSIVDGSQMFKVCRLHLCSSSGDIK